MSQKNQIESLIEFVQKATKLGKYNQNTGNGILHAIRSAEKGFSAEEPKEIDYLVNHLEELFIRQTDLDLSPQSQAVYFARIKRAAEDFKKYGTDARAIYSWQPKLRKASSKKNKNGSKDEDELLEEENLASTQQQVTKTEEIIKEVGGVKLNVVTWRLRPGVLIKLELPESLTRSDVEKIKKLLDLELETFE